MRHPSELRVNLLDPCNVGLGPPPVPRVRCDDPRLAFRGPRSSGFATMHTAPLPTRHHGVLAGGALAGFCQAPLTRPVRPKLGGPTSVNELFMVN